MKIIWLNKVVRHLTFKHNPFTFKTLKYLVLIYPQYINSVNRQIYMEAYAARRLILR